MKQFEGIDTYITTSRDKLKEQLSEYFKEYLQLDDVEIRKSSALGYLLQVATLLTSNLLFYSTITHRDSTLITAQLPESIYDLSAYLGYKPNMAVPANCDALISMSMANLGIGDEVIFKKNLKFTADDIEFILPNEIRVSLTTATTVEVKMITDTGNVLLANKYDSSNKNLQFLVNLIQYEIIENEFYVPLDLQPYQFYKLNVPIKPGNYLYDIEVYVGDEANATTIWQQYDNIFSMSSSTKGYILRQSNQSVNIYFGNGLFGKSPDAGSKIIVKTKETAGERGNIIPGSLKNIEGIYINTGSTRVEISYSATNPSPGYNGRNQETVDETRNNAIVNLRALGRLVSNEDFLNITSIVPALGKHVTTVLKRSDIKCNEVVLYSVIEFYQNQPVPTITKSIQINNTVDYIKPFTEYDVNGVIYFTPFELQLNKTNLEAKYYYYSKNVDISVERTYTDPNNTQFYVNRLNIQSDYDNREFKFNLIYQNDGLNLNDLEIKLYMQQGVWKGVLQFLPPELIDSNTNETYLQKIVPYEDLPDGYINGKIIVKDTVNDIELCAYDLVIDCKLDLYNFTRSQILKIDDTTYKVLDVQLIQKDWYDNLTVASGVDLKKTFEMRLIQQAIVNYDYEDIRMANIYISNKYANTTGELSNIKLVKPTYLCWTRDIDADNVDITQIPVGYHILINGPLNPDGSTQWTPPEYGDEFYNHHTHLATWNPGTNTWSFIEPKISESCYIMDTKETWFFNGREWFSPKFTTPLKIKLTAYLDIFDTQYKDYIKDKLYEYLIKNMSGINKNVYRSEIIRFVQSLENVVYCKLLEPSIDILFNFKIEDLSQDDLIEYTPQYVYFTKDKITIQVEKSGSGAM